MMFYPLNKNEYQINSEINIVVVTIYGLGDKSTVYSLEERNVKV